MVATILNLLATLPLLSAIVSATPFKPHTPPVVNIRNGTVIGVHSDVWDQDYFLGIPYSQPATGNNRFDLAKPFTKKWSKPFVANAYGDRCLGLNHPFLGLPESEDCLNLNIIRPAAGCSNKKLPVFVWIHGGGFTSSGSSNPPYNMTFQVEQSVKIGKPIIAVSINYRLTAWGMLTNTAMKNAGLSNIGLKDQRLALHWVQENIAAFGGDPKKVTIGGDSAGGMSVGVQLLAYGGRNDKLFRAAVMDSGPAMFAGAYGNMTNLDRMYGQLVDAVSCTSAADTLACLRQVPTDIIWPAIQAVHWTNFNQWQYIVDGDLIPELGSEALKKGHFLKVPILVGSTSDEGTYAVGLGVNTTEELIENFRGATVLDLSNETMAEILAAYPDDPVLGSPSGTIERFPYPYGYQYKRFASIAGDYFLIAGRRFTARSWAERGATVYSWRFNTIPNGVPREMGATHVADQAFVFANFLGVGYPDNYYDVSPPSRKLSYIKTGLLMSRSIMSFVHGLDPNGHGLSGYPKWPTYNNRSPKNFVFEGNSTSYIEPDTWRITGINIFIDKAAEFLH
ncbi:Cholinesterase [Dactylella cylindrospora]|nr:Cholinesterase [Dactylella cylindrospora]